MLIRAEFIGKQDGHTISGHKFANSFSEADKWLEEQKISPRVLGLAGLVPENFVLPFEAVALLVEDLDAPTEREVRLIHALNLLILHFRFDGEMI